MFHLYTVSAPSQGPDHLKFPQLHKQEVIILWHMEFIVTLIYSYVFLVL